jgi:phosphatidylserine/phosphatidylglycerophosphate/cardiolipin synthase-like enzyme
VARLIASAGAGNVKRQHMRNLQHNKTIVVSGPNLQKVVCGSTNFSWRGFYVQCNNAMVLTGASAVAPFAAAFEQYWTSGPTAFGGSVPAMWTDLGLAGVDAKVTFSPHSDANGALAAVAGDILTGTTSSLLYSLAFLYQTKGPVRDAITAITDNPAVFVSGISDRAVGGIRVQTPGGNVAPVYPAALSENVPVPFSKEPTGGGGIRMHHKFVVIDFDKPTARVYLGSYNFSGPADHDNGENLLLVTDQRVATAYAVEAVRLFDHYQFRVVQQDAATAHTRLALRKPPRLPGERPWFDDDFTDAHKILDRTLFS